MTGQSLVEAGLLRLKPRALGTAVWCARTVLLLPIVVFDLARGSCGVIAFSCGVAWSLAMFWRLGLEATKSIKSHAPTVMLVYCCLGIMLCLPAIPIGRVVADRKIESLLPELDRVSAECVARMLEAGESHRVCRNFDHSLRFTMVELQDSVIAVRVGVDLGGMPRWLTRRENRAGSTMIGVDCVGNHAAGQWYWGQWCGEQAHR